MFGLGGEMSLVAIFEHRAVALDRHFRGDILLSVLSLEQALVLDVPHASGLVKLFGRLELLI